jgi:hypothetical protein
MGMSKLIRLLALLILAVPTLAVAQVMQFDANVSADLKFQVLGDFQFLQTIQSAKASPLHQEIFGRVDGENYLKWFDARVFQFGVDTCGGAGSVACQKSEFKHKIFVTNNYITLGYPQIARLMTVFHEARHTEDENNNWPHALCSLFYGYRSIWTGGRLNWHYACDRTVYGSYGSASIMVHNVAQFCTNCSEKVKADAKIYADDQIHRITKKAAQNQIRADFNFQ